MKKHLFNLMAITLLALCSCKDNTPSYSIHTELQANYLADSYSNYSSYVNGLEDNSKPEPFKIDLVDVDIGSIITTYEDNKIVDSFTYYSADNFTYNLYNLKIGTKYKTTFSAISGDIAKTIEYKIDDVAPRNLYVDGVTNCRDLGGWKIDKKHRVKQGMIYRTAKYNEDESDALLITEKGIDALKNTLGVKTEIDLRKTSDNENGGITSSPLGKGVRYVSYPMVSNGNVLTLNKTKLRTLFEMFAEENNYPLAFHCSIGTDRTGMVAFLLNGLLGVSKEDLYRDYLFSNFGLIYSMRTASTIDTYLTTIESYSGKTLSEQFYNFLKDVGVQTSTLDKIKDLMIEKY